MPKSCMINFPAPLRGGVRGGAKFFPKNKISWELPVRPLRWH